MAEPAIKKQILDDLERLSPEKQKRAAELVHGLVSPLPQGTPGRELLRFAGTLDDESARQMMDAIEKGCERVEASGVDSLTAHPCAAGFRSRSKISLR